MTIQLFEPDPGFTAEANGTAEWMNAEIKAVLEADNARFDAEVALEVELSEPIVAKARDLGFDPGMADADRLAQHLKAERERRRSEIDQSGEFGILPQNMPAAPTVETIRRQTATRPYFGSGSSARSGQNGAFADRSGRMTVNVNANTQHHWSWASASVAARFWTKTHANSLFPQCFLRDRGFTAHAWGFFSASTVQLDVYVFTFNKTTGQHWLKRNTLYRYVNAWFGNVGFPSFPAFYSADGYGQAANMGDEIIVTVELIARAVSPTGSASLDHEADLLSVSIAG